MRDVVFIREEEGRPAGFMFIVEDPKGARYRGGGGVEHTYARLTGGKLDAAMLMAKYFLVYGLAKHPLRLLFPRVSATGELLNERMTDAEFNRELSLLLTHARLPNHYTSKDLRAGRETQLRAAGVRPDLIRILGRWKEEKTSEIYQRPAPDMVRQLPPF